jgi:hypothetical protein
MLLYRPAKIIDMVGMTKVYDPPMTAGRRVPKKDCNNVLMPDTSSIVCTTFALSS